MNTILPDDFYRHRIKSLGAERKKIAAKKNAIGWGRLVAIVAVGVFFWAIKNHNLFIAITIAIICFAVFLRLIVVAIKVSRQLENTDQLIAINNQELEMAAGYYNNLPDGLAYLPALHPYAYDLDIFGRSSLYQYTSRTTTQQGGYTLAQWLLSPANEIEIKQRQEAAKEIAGLPQWSQQLQAYGRAKTITNKTQQKIEQWLANENDYFNKPIWQIIRWVGPFISIAVLALYIGDVITYEVFFLCLFILFIITGFISKKATPAYQVLGKIAPEVAALSELVRQVEQQPFQSNWMQQKQAVFLNQQSKASVAIRKLNGILSRLDYRLNPVAFIPLNIFLFWDLQQMLSFKQWKKNYVQQAENWFSSLAEIEAINSIGILHFNHPQWSFPEIKEEHGFFKANDLGHPLLPNDKVVRSDFHTQDVAKIAIITGSNMAGKSTFLRSIGLALILGQAGAPVCAASASFSSMNVISTMRISDNLEESTSTFYAELKKLKDIIDAINRHEKVFLLMDEILRGTNSLDRHTGSKALIQQLIKQNACGIIATHDLALAGLVNAYPHNIANYHFDVQVSGEELYFDYKLKQGICKSLNASVLMKKIGIEI